MMSLIVRDATLEEVHRTFPWGRGAGGVSAFPLLTGHQHTAMVRAAQGAQGCALRRVSRSRAGGRGAPCRVAG